MQIQLRPMQIEDAEAVTALSHQLGYQLSVGQTAVHIKEVRLSTGHCAFVAVVENKIIGWVHAFKAIRIESPPFVEIAGLVVDESYRGKGTGSALINKIQTWCCNENVIALRVRCNTKRMEAHKFYHRLHFVESKEQKIFELRL